MTSGPQVVAGTVPVPGLLAVLGGRGELLAVSEALQRLLSAGRVPFELPVDGLLPWLPDPDTGPPDTAGPDDPVAARQTERVLLRDAQGFTRGALLTRVPLPDQGVTFCVLHLAPGAAADDTAVPDAAQLVQLLYQLPVAAVAVNRQGQLVYANAQAIRNAQVTEPGHRRLLGLNDREVSERLGKDLEQARRREENLRRALQDGVSVRWVDQVAVPGLPPEYWRRSFAPVLNTDGTSDLVLGVGIEVTGELHRSAELELLGHVVQNTSEAVLIVDRTELVEDSRIIFANRVARRLLAGTGGPLVGRSLLETVVPLLTPAQQARFFELLRAGRGSSGPVLYARGTIAERCLEVTVMPGGARTSRETHSHTSVAVRDVTAVHRAQVLEGGRARSFRLALDGAPMPEVLGSLVETLEGQMPGMLGSVMLLRGDRLSCAAAPQLPQELVQRIEGRQVGPGNGPCALAVHLDRTIVSADVQHDGRFQADWALARAFGVRSVWSVPFRGKGGEVLGTFALYSQACREPRPAQLAVMEQLARLVAILLESRQASERMERVAYHDTLTGLPNRSAFLQALEDHTRSGEGLPVPVPGADGRQWAVGLIDLTDFRHVNEAYGQVAGNRLLHLLAGRLQEAVPDGTMVARLGGDEFGVLLPTGGNPDVLGPLSGALQGVIGTPFQVGEQEVTLRAAIGWSLYPELALDPVTLLSQADTAMYTARHEGQEYRLYSHHGQDWNLSPTTLRAALQDALAGEQMHVAYQPLVGRDGRVRSFEALLRWTHPQYGNIGPDQFIPVAETSGLIRHLGGWVLEQSMRAALTWPSDVLVSVNISGRQFEHPGFAGVVADALARTGLPSARLELELTESALMIGSERAMHTLAQLDALGVRVALDDYGVGYSNLMRLYTLPISTIKLDRSFSRDLHSAADTGLAGASAAIIRNVVGLAHDLGLEVVVEGIETPAQLQAVLALGCDTVQGYLYSRPLPADAALAWLQRAGTDDT